MLVTAACASIAPPGHQSTHETPFGDQTVGLTLLQEVDIGMRYAAAVAARGNDLYMVDQVQHRLVHFDIARREWRPVAEMRSTSMTGLFVSEELYVFVVDRFERSIRQLDSTGRIARVFAHPDLLVSPVDVTMVNFDNQLIVADDLQNHLVVFDRLGNVISILGEARSGNQLTQSIGAISSFGDQVLIADPLMSEIARIDLRGFRTASYGEDDLRYPVAVTADPCGRIFVADRSLDHLFVEAPGVSRSADRVEISNPGASGVTDLWVDDNRLYVALGESGIGIYAVTPPCNAF